MGNMKPADFWRLIVVLMIPVLIILAISLGGCSTTNGEKPIVEVTGPKFPGSRFDCGNEPIPPDPATVGVQGGSSAARYENRLSTWGNGCKNKLKSVGSELKQSGQVIY